MVEKKSKAAAEKVAAKPVKNTVTAIAVKKYFDKVLREFKTPESKPYEISAERFDYLSEKGFVKSAE